MKLALRISLPFLILTLTGLLAWWFVANKPEPRQSSPPLQVTNVEGATLKPANYQILLATRGTILPRTTTTLIPQVSGRIESISPNFREGGFFKAGEVLISIEKADYQAALVRTQSLVAQARTGLTEEKARGEQALANWRRLGSGTPSEMVLRKPQLAEAEARLKAAEEDVKQAERDIYRTDIRAPYDGRIIEQQVDVGQHVSTGTQLGRAFATDVMEVRLPLNNHQLGFVDLPESYRENRATLTERPEVTITAKIGRSESSWNGEVVRVDSLIDAQSRQLFVVAEINDPYRAAKPGGAPLKIGMFVDAAIKGRKLEDVFVLPRSAVRVSGEVILIDRENRIQRTPVTPIWEDRDHFVVDKSGGLRMGDVLCLTPIAYPVNGALVSATIDGVASWVEEPARAKGGKGGGKGKGGKGGKGKGVNPSTEADT
ncbi:MAG: efflux RND transporter periplasmic adaptor subunit [Verrucomicrobiota bacterium]